MPAKECVVSHEAVWPDSIKFGNLAKILKVFGKNCVGLFYIWQIFYAMWQFLSL